MMAIFMPALAVCSAWEDRDERLLNPAWHDILFTPRLLICLLQTAKRARRERVDQDELVILQGAAAVTQAAAAVVALAAAESDSDDDDGRSLPRPGGSNADGRPDYWQSPWGRMLTEQAEQLRDPASPQAKVFRRRFRAPYRLALLYSDWTKEAFGSKAPIANQPAVPMELKVLGVLRILGRGCTTDDVKELSFISETCMSAFFHRFCEWGRVVMFPKWVTWPTSKEEIAKAMGPYCALGFDGAMGSTDAVHIAWGGCPQGLAVLHTGKEGCVPRHVANQKMHVFSTSRCLWNLLC